MLRSTPTSESCAGLLIVGHGTRDPDGISEFGQVVGVVAARLEGIVVEGGFLELAEPSIAAAMSKAVRRGADRHLDVVPLVLFAAGHAKSDIPRAVAAASAEHGGLSVRLLPHLGCHDRIVELSTLRYREALATRTAVGVDETLLMMVGRGSHDTSANGEMARFARLRFERLRAGWLEVCFTAMAEPLLPRALELVAALPFRRVVVQPHLLFHGELFERVRSTVWAQAEMHGGAYPASRDWVVTGPLGPHRLLGDAIVDLAVSGEHDDVPSIPCNAV
jgi:sirohydrochlorin cobaltochelatase